MDAVPLENLFILFKQIWITYLQKMSLTSLIQVHVSLSVQLHKIRNDKVTLYFFLSLFKDMKWTRFCPKFPFHWQYHVSRGPCWTHLHTTVLFPSLAKTHCHSCAICFTSRMLIVHSSQKETGKFLIKWKEKMPKVPSKTMFGLHLSVFHLSLSCGYMATSKAGNFPVVIMHISKCSQKPGITASARWRSLDDRELDAMFVEAVD